MLARFGPLPAAPPPLPAGEVHVWHCPLPFAGELTPEERARAERYQHAPAREQFVAGRAALRTILAGYLGCRPLEVKLSVNAEGKPHLAGDPGEPLEFNVSHTHGLAVLAFARVPVGVDVEWLRPLANAAGLVARYFSAAEQAEFATLPESEREPAVWRGWTQKEAVLKGIGCGVRDLDRCQVRLAPGPAAIVAPPQTRAAWQVVAWGPTPEHLAALAVRTGGELLSSPDGCLQEPGT